MPTFDKQPRRLNSKSNDVYFEIVDGGAPVHMPIRRAGSGETRDVSHECYVFATNVKVTYCGVDVTHHLSSLGTWLHLVKPREATVTLTFGAEGYVASDKPVTDTPVTTPSAEAVTLPLVNWIGWDANGGSSGLANTFDYVESCRPGLQMRHFYIHIGPQYQGLFTQGQYRIICYKSGSRVFDTGAIGSGSENRRNPLWQAMMTVSNTPQNWTLAPASPPGAANIDVSSVSERGAVGLPNALRLAVECIDSGASPHWIWMTPAFGFPLDCDTVRFMLISGVHVGGSAGTTRSRACALAMMSLPYVDNAAAVSPTLTSKRPYITHTGNATTAINGEYRLIGYYQVLNDTKTISRPVYKHATNSYWVMNGDGVTGLSNRWHLLSADPRLATTSVASGSTDFGLTGAWGGGTWGWSWENFDGSSLTPYHEVFFA